MDTPEARPRASTRLLAALWLILALGATSATANSIQGKVVKVTDGDTITVLVGREQYRVRLAGIDAPEKAQPYGQASRKSLAKLVAGKVVRVDYYKEDRYQRLVGTVLLPFPKSLCTKAPCPEWLDLN